MRNRNLKLITTTAFILAVVFFTECNKKTDSSGTVPTVTDSAVVTVVNGYGSGKYKIGDTVHIWAATIATNTAFNNWTGYSPLIENAGEWHNAFIMPAQNVTVTGNVKTITPFTLVNEKIKGKSILKNVYYYFPAGHKGIVYLLHGTSGTADNIANTLEWQTMIKDLVTDNFAVIITEAEEASLKTDLDGDGKLRWATLPLDSVTNVDYANIKTLTDTFYTRGYTSRSLPRFSIGMSNGGYFSSTLSYLYKFKSGISYCAPTAGLITSTSVTPFQFCMAKYDDHPEVGAQGNANALTNSQALTSRGICSKYFSHDHSPVYNERFARRADISITTSTALVNELRTNNWLTSKNYLKANSEAILADIQANASRYPVFMSLSISQKLEVANQIDAMLAGHQFYSDYNKTTIKFLNTLCQ